MLVCLDDKGWGSKTDPRDEEVSVVHRFHVIGPVPALVVPSVLALALLGAPRIRSQPPVPSVVPVASMAPGAIDVMALVGERPEAPYRKGIEVATSRPLRFRWENLPTGGDAPYGYALVRVRPSPVLEAGRYRVRVRYGTSTPVPAPVNPRFKLELKDGSRLIGGALMLTVLGPGVETWTDAGSLEVSAGTETRLELVGVSVDSWNGQPPTLDVVFHDLVLERVK